jgi:hypothetical protein
MLTGRAVVSIDHHKALVQRFNADDVQAEKVRDHRRNTRQHASGVRTEHEFFGEVCGALTGISEVLVVGGHTAQADFRRYVEKHRPELSFNLVGWETVDHPSDGQLIALARKFFEKYDRLRASPLQT